MAPTDNGIDPALIAFDFDGVVANTMGLFLTIARRDYHLEGLRYEDITSYSLEECLGIDPQIMAAIIERLLAGDDFAELHPLDGSIDVLARMGRSNHSLLFVTARSKAAPVTQWLQQHLSSAPVDFEVVATGSFDNKDQVLKSWGKTHFVEDRLATCLGLAEAGIAPIVFKQPWNRRPHPFVEVADWQEIAALLSI